MGFLEKVKNMFTEEVEDDDVKVEKVKSEVTRVAIDSPNTKDEEDDFDLKYSTSEDEFKKNKPIFFDEDDFNDLEFSNKKEEKIEKKEEPVKKVEEVKEVFKEEVIKEPEPVEKKIFRPTPIISPVYGILDKNYHKEDIVSKNDIKSDDYIVEPSIDTIRNKAYGTLEDELENTLFSNSSPLFKQDKSTDDIIEEIDGDRLSNLTDDISKELDELLIEKEKYLSTVEKKEVEAKHAKSEKKESKSRSTKEKKETKEDTEDDDILDFIDSTLYKEGEDSE